ncbi:unnamed protein product [Sphacelaria rigidula]
MVLRLPSSKPARRPSHRIGYTCFVADFRLHEAPHTGDIGENDPMHHGFQVPGVLGLRHFCPHVDFASSNKPIFLRGLLRHHSFILSATSERVCSCSCYRQHSRAEIVVKSKATRGLVRQATLIEPRAAKRRRC